MKNYLARFTLLLVVGSVWLTSCKNTKEFGEQEKLAIGDTINMMMDQVMHFAETATTDSTFQWISDDSSAVFMSGGMAFSAREINSLFRNAYGEVKLYVYETGKLWVSDGTVLTAGASGWHTVGEAD